ncbi:MAG: hypothetical protein WC878_06970 [Candidatus Paceibacterota bacterium]|jgi:hypothetical protein
MINLLTATEKQKIRKEYHLLVFSMCVPTLFFVLLIAILSFLPSFFLTTTNYRTLYAESQSTEVVTKQSQEQEMKKTVSDTNAKIALLKKQDTAGDVQGLFREILESRPYGVYITSFSYGAAAAVREKQSADTSPNIIVRGKAENRADLLSFADVLRKKKSFSSVDLPISSLISGTNLSYVLNIVVAR